MKVVVGLGKSSSPRPLDLVDYQVQKHWVWHVCQTHIILDLANYYVKVPWTWLIAKSEYIGSDTFARDSRYIRLG